MNFITRRTFMKGVGASAAFGPLGFYDWDFRPDGGAVRRPRKIRPGGKLNVACIGVGGKGHSDTMSMIGENIVALCDVEENPAKIEDVLKAFPDAKRYTDYRKMLTEMDDQIDAVTISTPDHTHFPAARMAIEMGKHVYCQKPLTHTIWEARELTRMARKHGVVTQMGNQHHSGEGIRLACEWIKAGAIGDVREVHVWTNRPGIGWGIDSGGDRPTETQPVPGTLDWDLWLGTAPKRPYNSAYAPKKWRTWWDYGTGALGDMGCHIMDASYFALDLGYPKWVEAETSSVNNETIPKWSIITYQFPKRGSMPPVTLTWYDGGKLPARPAELEEGRRMSSGGGQLIVGDKGTIMADASCESPRLIPETKMRDLLKNPPAKTIPRSPGHYVEWIRACKGEGKTTSNFDYAGPFTEVVLLGNLAIRAGKRIAFDPKKMAVTGMPKLDKLIHKAYRKF